MKMVGKKKAGRRPTTSVFFIYIYFGFFFLPVIVDDKKQKIKIKIIGWNHSVIEIIGKCLKVVRNRKDVLPREGEFWLGWWPNRFGLVSSCYVWKVGGRRALTMQIYLWSSLVVIGQLVVFIVPFFILMSNVHRENMQTQKNIINSWKWRAVKHSNKSPLVSASNRDL